MDQRRVKYPPKQRGDYSAKTAAYDIKASESGTIFKWDSATSFNFNLPAVVPYQKGIFFHFTIATAATSGTGHGVSPNANDKVFGSGTAPTDNKDVYFATAGDAIGNGFTLVSDGVDGWHLLFPSGTLSQEA